MTTEWAIEIGDVVTRSDIHSVYGGGSQGGIEPSATTPNVIVYSDRFEGAKYGYVHDGWAADGTETFIYSGEGRVGDQRMREGNRAILHHIDDGRALRLFVTLDSKQKQSGGKRHRYIGEFVVDPVDPYRIERGPDVNGDERDVIVFKLDSKSGRRFESDAGVQGAIPDSKVGPSEHGDPETPEDDSGDTEPAGEVDLVDPESHTVEQFTSPPKAGHIAVKAEATLVGQWEHHLRSQGRSVRRARIHIDGEKASIVTDTFDVTAQVLYEAKSASDRSTVRLAVGQLMDYLRFFNKTTSGAILLPSAPTQDIKAFVANCGFGLVYRELGAWVIT